MKAPCKKGDSVGEMLVYKDGVQIDSVPLVAYESVGKANLFDCIQDVAEGWNKR